MTRAHQVDSERLAFLKALWDAREALIKRRGPAAITEALFIINRAVMAPSNVDKAA